MSHYFYTGKRNSGDLMTKLMGILNITPDSFFDGGKYFDLDKAILKAKEFEKIGVDIIDIGGESTRPHTIYNSCQDFLPVKEELKRVIPVIEALSKEISIPLSIDTFKPEVAREALIKGATFINDVTGLRNDDMKRVIKDANCPFIVMHMLGDPKTMQNNPFYPNGVVKDLLKFFEEKIIELEDFGVNTNKMILDPGIGFGKTVEDNLEIIKSVREFKKFGLEIMIGASRKSFLAKILNKTADQLLPATLAIHTITLMGGADYIRVHDASEHKDIINIIESLKKMEVK